MKKLFNTTLIVLLLIVAIGVNAQPHNKGNNMGKGMSGMCENAGMMNNSMMPLHLLNLTDKQFEKISKMKFDMRMKMIDFRSKKQKLELELEQLFMAKDLNKKKILNKVEEIGKIKTDMQKFRYENMINMYNLLTDEQKEMLLKFRMSNMPKMRNQKMMK